MTLAGTETQNVVQYSAEKLTEFKNMLKKYRVEYGYDDRGYCMRNVKLTAVYTNCSK